MVLRGAGLPLIAILLATGHIRPHHAGVTTLRIDGDRLYLSPLGEPVVEASFAERSPAHAEGDLRAWVTFSRVSYIRLLVAGGPLGPRELFFQRESEYAAKAWAALRLPGVGDASGVEEVAGIG